MERRVAFVDMQGFKDNSNRFVLKEIAVVTSNASFHDVIKSPFAFRHLNKKRTREAKWLTKNHHGIHWNAGTMSMTQLRTIIRPMLHRKVIYVKGIEKVQWIRFILNYDNNNNGNDDNESKSINIVNLDSIDALAAAAGGCTSLKQPIKIRFVGYENMCKNHPNDQFHCALKNVLAYKILYMHLLK